MPTNDITDEEIAALLGDGGGVVEAPPSPSVEEIERAQQEEAEVMKALEGIFEADTPTLNGLQVSRFISRSSPVTLTETELAALEDRVQSRTPSTYREMRATAMSEASDLESENFRFSEEPLPAPPALSRGLRCPLCNAQLVRKDGRFGSFYGCSRYHRTGCSGSMNMDQARQATGDPQLGKPVDGNIISLRTEVRALMKAFSSRYNSRALNEWLAELGVKRSQISKSTDLDFYTNLVAAFNKRLNPRDRHQIISDDFDI